MTTLRVAIINDDVILMEDLKKKCLAYFSKIDYDGSVEKIHVDTVHVESMFAMDSVYDFLFIDADMQHISGLQIAEVIRRYNKKIGICFIAQSMMNASLGYRVHAFDYIESPITQRTVNKVLGDIIAYKLCGQQEYQYYQTADGLASVYQDDILYFEYVEKSPVYKNRSVVIHMMNHADYLIEDRLSSIYDNLDKELFLIPYVSFIVNMNHVVELQKENIVMRNGDLIPITQSRRKDIKLAFDQRIKKVEKREYD